MSIKRLEQLLKTHDWYYNYSDDSRWYNAGSRESEEIHQLLLAVPLERARQLWQKYAPTDFGFPQSYIERHTVEPHPKLAVGARRHYEVYNAMMLRPVPVEVEILSAKTEKTRAGWVVKYEVEVKAVPLGSNGRPVTSHVNAGERFVVEEAFLQP